MNGADSTSLTPMIVGVAVAVLFLIAAFFLDTILALLRGVFGGVSRMVGASATRTGQAGAAAAGRTSRRVRDLFVGLLDRRGDPARAAPVPVDRPPPEPTRAPVAELSDEEVLEGLRLPQYERPSTRAEGLQRQRVYRPSGSIHVEASVREFMVRSGGSVALGGLVRHLDREFGSGLGVSLIESLRNRGVLQIRRRPDAPTELDVTLATPSVDGGARR